jgi:biopolymer transport protein ExbB
MKKRSTRLGTTVKTKVKVQNRMRFVAAAGALALGIFSVALLYNTLGNSKDSIANNRWNGMETLAEYKFRKKIIINAEEIPAGETLKDFPVMVTIKDNDLRSAANGGKMVSESAADIRFTKDDGVTLLDYEIERYNPVTGELLAWVRTDALNNLSTKPIYLYFSNKFAANESSSNAWNKTYKGVWHLRGALSTKIPFANQLAQKPVMIEDKEVYVAAEKNSSQFPCLNTPDDVDITGEISISAWIYLTDKKEQTIVSNQSGFNGGYRLSVSKDRHLDFNVRNENAEPAEIAGKSGMELQKETWYYVSAVYSDSGDSMATYINGKYDRGIKTQLSMAGSTEPLQLGREPSKKIYYFGGVLDEVNISNIVRSGSWIQTAYANQASPEKFMKIGQTEAIQQQISMTLLTFDGEAQGNTVELKWLTANEVDNKLFEIERSSDGIGFASIGTKPGAGNSNEVLSYTFRDNSPLVGTNYYRVKLVNESGAEEYSMITPVNVEPAGMADIKISAAQPNPFIKDFQVEYVVPKNGNAHVKFMSVTGEVVLEEDVVCEKNAPSKFFYKDDKGLKPGVYFLSVAQDDDKKMVKLIKRM